jgi:hypothetical protein
LNDERGAVVVLFALVLIVLFAFVAFAIDISRLYRERQLLQNAVDFGALAGGQMLPVETPSEAAAVEAVARDVAVDNAPQLASGNLTISFRCIAGDRDRDRTPDPGDIPAVCGPATGTWSSGWTFRRDRAMHDCDPYAGDRCNGIVLRASSTVPYYFAPVIGFLQGSTGVVNAVACTGRCGRAASPVDTVVVFDRTRSMTETDMANAKNAFRTVLQTFDDEQQWVGLVALPSGQLQNACAVQNPQNYPDRRASTWQQIPGLSNDYRRADGSLNPASRIVQQLECLQRTPRGIRVRVNGVDRTGAGHTNLGDPMDAASEILARYGRADVPDAIIFFTDGEANQPAGFNPCSYLNSRATAAKNAGVSVYTIAYGVADARCRQDTGGQFAGRFASTNLAAAATASNDNAPGSCASDENTDGDYYFCESGSADLEETFRQVAEAILKGSRLIE